METEEPPKIVVTVKTQSRKEPIEVYENLSVGSFKEILSTRFETPLEQLCLIFAGKILKDSATLKECKIRDGLTVHLVIRAKKEEDSVPSMDSLDNQPSFFNQPLQPLFANLLNAFQSPNETLQPVENQHDSLNAPSSLEHLQTFLADMLNNPETLRTLQLAGNPATAEELANVQDRALRNIESIPGGYSALQRLYHDVQVSTNEHTREHNVTSNDTIKI